MTVEPPQIGRLARGESRRRRERSRARRRAETVDERRGDETRAGAPGARRGYRSVACKDAGCPASFRIDEEALHARCPACGTAHYPPWDDPTANVDGAPLFAPMREESATASTPTRSLARD